MNTSRLLRITITVLALAMFPSFAPAQESGAKKDAHVGTWKQVSTKYGDATEFTKRGDESMRIKHITATHFTWVEVATELKRIMSGAGGKYTVEGTTYTETIDYAGEGMEDFVGKPQKFTIKVEGDKLYQSGELSNGLKIEEVWERMK